MGRNALWYALLNQKEKVVNILLAACEQGEKQLDINIQDNNGYTALHAISMCQHSKKLTIEYLIQHCKINVKLKDFKNRTASDVAFEYGDYDTAAWLEAMEQSSCNFV